MAKYFDSIDHYTLLSLLHRKVKDENVLKLVERITRNSDASRGLEVGKGRLQKRKDEFQKGLITEDCFVMSVRSMFDHVSFANSFRLRESALVSRAGVA